MANAVTNSSTPRFVRAAIASASQSPIQNAWRTLPVSVNRTSAYAHEAVIATPHAIATS